MNLLATLIGSFFGVAYYVFTYWPCGVATVILAVLLLSGCDWLRGWPTPIP
jgi:hypothetical protein